MKEKKIGEILSQTERGYDMVAGEFSASRPFPWKDFQFISEYAEKGDRILDYGCGNGRFFDLFKDKPVEYSGVDVSAELIKEAKRKFPEFSDRFSKISVQDSLPFPDGFFNTVLSIAVFHHFPPEHAEKMAKEIFRVTAHGGTAIITVWNLHQEKYHSQIANPMILAEKILGIGKYSGLGMKDIIIPFKGKNGKEFSRYHRVYDEKGLADIFSRAGFSIKNVSIISGRNLAVLAEKK